VAAVLHLGNINFAKGRETDSSVIKDEKSRFHLNTAAELLMYVLCFQISLLLTLLVIFCNFCNQLALGILITGVIVRS
jgi:hypothetical protein